MWFLFLDSDTTENYVRQQHINFCGRGNSAIMDIETEAFTKRGLWLISLRRTYRWILYERKRMSQIFNNQWVLAVN